MKTYLTDDDGVCADIPSTCLGKLCRKPQITIHFENCGGAPSALQREAAERLAAGKDDYAAVIAAAAMAHWNEAIRENPRWHEGLEPVGSPLEVAGKLRIGTIYIHSSGSSLATVKIGFGGSWDLDPEHGFGVMIRDQRVIDIGHEDVAFTDDDAVEVENEFTIRSELKSLERMLAQTRGMVTELDADTPDLLKLAMAMQRVDPQEAIRERIRLIEARIAALQGKLPKTP